LGKSFILSSLKKVEGGSSGKEKRWGVVLILAIAGEAKRTFQQDPHIKRTIIIKRKKVVHYSISDYYKITSEK